MDINERAMEVALSEATEVLFYIDRCKRDGIPLIRAFKACGVDIIIKGKGSAQAHREAISIFEKGMEIGCGDCAEEISNLHRFDRIKGASEEGRAWWLEKARKLWEKQALGGDAYSANCLANSYRNSDKVKCKFWRNKAIEIDESYKEFYRDIDEDYFFHHRLWTKKEYPRTRGRNLGETARGIHRFFTDYPENTLNLICGKDCHSEYAIGGYRREYLEKQLKEIVDTLNGIRPENETEIYLIKKFKDYHNQINSK